MDITTSTEDGTARIALAGSLNTNTASELEQALEPLFGTISRLVFDFTELEYISSAGLRVLLSAQKTMNRQGSMAVRHVSQIVMEIFDITGFSDFLSIE